MNSTGEGCEICHRRDAAVFMVVRQGKVVAKAHACFTCFEMVQANKEVDVEAVSLQELKEIPDTEAARWRENWSPNL